MSNKRLWELFNPDFENGVLFRKNSQGGVPIGGVAGYLTNRNYYKVKVDGKSLFTHRVLYAMYHGIALDKCPNIDPIDRDSTNNKITNLRACVQSDNCANRGVFSSSKSGFKGVSVKGNGKFEAYCVKYGKRYYLGVYDTPEEAHNAYLNKAREVHGDYCYE